MIECQCLNFGLVWGLIVLNVVASWEDWLHPRPLHTFSVLRIPARYPIGTVRTSYSQVWAGRRAAVSASIFNWTFGYSRASSFHI